MKLAVHLVHKPAQLEPNRKLLYFNNVITVSNRLFYPQEKSMAHHPINKVAVIGAGISGVVSAAHLLAAGVRVTVFERNKAAGGVWYV